MHVFREKGKEVLMAVLPMLLIVLILHFTITPLPLAVLFRFLIGIVLVLLGLTIFLVGVDIGITPIGNTMGESIAKSNKMWVVLIAGLVLGFIGTVAEPDLHILAGQVDEITNGAVGKFILIFVVSIGIAVMLAVGFWRIVRNVPLYRLLTIVYVIILGLGLFTSREFLAISFDASGATTGALTVPFMLALSIGVSHMKKDSKASEKDSFGLVAVASTGAVISVMLMSFFFKKQELSEVVPKEIQNTVWEPFFSVFPTLLKETFIALLPIVVVFYGANYAFLHVKRRSLHRISAGLVFTFVGLVFFLVGVNGGLMDVGKSIGKQVASNYHPIVLLLVAFVLGFVAILAEPAVYVLTRQIETVTSGYVRKKVVFLFLSVGVGLAVVLSMLRILIPALQLWQILLPGYALAIALTYIVPKLFVGMAFDAGGVASGTMSATFILAFTQGSADAVEGADILADAFGMIGLVAMTPILALLLLGLLYKWKAGKKGE